MVAVEVTTHECAGITHQTMVSSRREPGITAVGVRHAITHEGAAAGACCRCCLVKVSQLGGGEADFGLDQGHGSGVTGQMPWYDWVCNGWRGERNGKRNTEIDCGAAGLPTPVTLLRLFKRIYK